MKRIVWITFDLGVRGDYEGLYEWLDGRRAKECGDSAAVLQYDVKSDLVAELKRELKKAVNLTKRSRIYVIYTDESSRIKGSFLFGKRKQAPWTGYGSVEEEETVDEL